MSFAFLFPGQGSQSVGMMAPFESLPGVRSTFDEAGAALGFDLWSLVENGPEDELGKTVNTQPIMLVAGVALYRAWKGLGGPDPAVVAGHSLGEYTALVVAGVLDFGQTVPLVRFRAQAMQEAVPEGTGAMAAILGLDEAALSGVCQDAASAGVAEPANFNSPGHVVIAGEAAGVRRAMELAKERGAKRTVLLPMSAPSHCSLMLPAAGRLQKLLDAATIRAPSIPIINNVDVAEEKVPERIRDALMRQLSNPVRWSQIVSAIAARGVDLMVECGPGGVLAGLNKRIVPDVKTVGLRDADGLRDLLQQVGSRA